MYACPNCKSVLKTDRCTECGFEIQWADGLPEFFTGSAVSNQYKQIGTFYDNLYSETEDTWNQLAARGSEFVKFIASLVMQSQPSRYLDVGCGEGHLLSAVKVEEKYGIELSRKALRAKTVPPEAHLWLGFAEQLPNSNEYFDAGSSIGVMTHFIEDFNATKEIHRVLSSGGIYIVGVYVPARLAERILAKAIEFIYLRPKPLVLFQWTINRLLDAANPRGRRQGNCQDKQPIGRYYSANQVELLFNRAGFLVQDLITKIKRPKAPLAGQHFRIYILKKSQD
jgi:SAM-dependent methyltransferase